MKCNIMFCVVGNPALKSTERTLKSIIEASKLEFVSGRKFLSINLFARCIVVESEPEPPCLAGAG